MRTDTQNTALAIFSYNDSRSVDHGPFMRLVLVYFASEIRQRTKVPKPLPSHRRHDRPVLVADFKNALELAEDGSSLIG